MGVFSAFFLASTDGTPGSGERQGHHRHHRRRHDDDGKPRSKSRERGGRGEERRSQFIGSALE